MGVYDTIANFSTTELMNHLNEWPHQVSTQVLDQLKFDSLLDAGCGTNANLAHYATVKRGARYLGIDYGRTKTDDDRVVDVVEALRYNYNQLANRPSFFTVKEDLRHLKNLCFQPYDVAHMRFVLMHLPRHEWERILNQLRAVTRRYIVLAEWDWQTFYSSHEKLGHHVNEFRDSSLGFMAKIGAIPITDADLEFVSNFPDTTVTYKSFARKEDSYLKDLFALAVMQRDIAASRGMKESKEDFNNFAIKFDYLIKRGAEIPFHPPSICTAVIKLQPTPNQSF